MLQKNTHHSGLIHYVECIGSSVSGYRVDSTVREIVNISKRAIEEYAKIDPAWVMEFVRAVEYPISAVGHEPIMHAICFLPDVYANEAIGWICQDFDEKMLEKGLSAYVKLVERGRLSILYKTNPSKIHNAL